MTHDKQRTELEGLKTAFVASLTNANAGMRWLDHDSMDEMIEAAWVGFEQPAADAIQSLLSRVEEAESPEHFLVAYVSQDTKVIGIDHPTEASWEDVLQAHIALRDRLNVRIAEQDKCPFARKAIEASREQ